MQQLPGSFSLDGQRFSVWSGNPAFPADSADGATFWAVNAKRSDRVMFFLVVRQDASGALTLCHQSEPTPVGAGQGTLRAEAGRLVASYFVESGDGKPTRQVEIAGYVPFASAPGGGGPVAAEDAAPIAALGSEAWPNYGQPYLDESLIKDGRWYVRANKIVGLLVQLARAVAQLQRLARAQGWLR